MDSKCLDQPYTEVHTGHSSHALWQKGEKVSCAQCGLSLHLDGQQRIILTGALKIPCKGAAISGSPPLPELFRKQVEQATQKANSQDDNQGQSLAQAEQDRAEYQNPNKVPRLEEPTQAFPNQRPNQGPTPRRLHFSTALDSLNSDTPPATTALAMNPSHRAVAGRLRAASLGTGTTLRAAQNSSALDTQEHGEEESPADDEPLSVEFF